LVDALELLRAVDECDWAPPGETLARWRELGVAHGFGGVGSVCPSGAFHARQVHGTTILSVVPGTAAAAAPLADALATTLPGALLAVKTADCLPVLLTGGGGRFAAAVHAGWRGLTAGILGRALAAADRSGVTRRELAVAIGPAIGLERFEVGFEVVTALSGPALGLSREALALCVAKGRGDRWHADLQLAAVLALLAEGLAPSQVAVVRASTYDDARWHSFRREGRGFGSNWSWIATGSAAGGR
jgi:YfiH family protein